MKKLFSGLLAALIVAALQAAADDAQKAGPPAAAPNPADPLEQEYKNLLASDDAAQDEAAKWAQEAAAAADAGNPVPQATVRERIRQRMDVVKKAYEDFIQRNPKHVRVRLAYGSFLNDTGDALGALQQWETARQLDPANPAAWNNLAKYYGEHGPIKKAFEYYQKAIELNPNESVYYHNLALTVYLFRTEAREYFGLSDTQALDKTLDLYRKAMKLDPSNFVLATDYAESYYGMTPTPWAEAVKAWAGTMKLAHDEVERQGVCIHLARCLIHLGLFDEARTNLEQVTNTNYAILKKQILLRLEQAVKDAASSSGKKP